MKQKVEDVFHPRKLAKLASEYHLLAGVPPNHLKPLSLTDEFANNSALQ